MTLYLAYEHMGTNDGYRGDVMAALAIGDRLWRFHKIQTPGVDEVGDESAVARR